MTEQQGPEPTGWELLRGLNRIEERLTGMASSFVSQVAFEGEKSRVQDRFDGQGREIAELKKDRDEAATKAAAAEQRADEQRTRNRWQLIGLISSPFATAIVLFIVQGGLKP